MERREKFRKSTNLFGSILNNFSDKKVLLNKINIVNLSVNGIRFRLVDEPRFVFKPGDELLVKFMLNEQNQALIERELFIRSYNNPFISAEFKEGDCNDPICFRIFLFE